jgi:autotransporter-associated beta strand protein
MKNLPRTALRGLFSLLVACALWAASAVSTSAQSFTRPGIPFSAADINQLKANIGTEPWASAFASFSSASHSSLGYGPQGPHAIVGRAPNVNLNQFNNDMRAIHNLTWMWVFTGNNAYAQKATDLLDAWAVTNTQWSGDETFLALGDAAEHFVTAADILRSMYPGWTQANTDHVNHWFANVLWPEADVPNPVRGANQGAIQLKLALGVAAFLGDQTKWEQAISVFRKDAAGALPNSLPNGQVGDTGRDEGHWAGQLIALAWCAEVAWKQGIDVFADLDHRLLVANELYSRFQLDQSGLTYIPFGGAYAFWTGSFGGPFNARRAMYTHNIIENAYVRRKGLSAPYTLQLRSQISQSFEHLLFRRTADTSTAVALPPVVHPTTAPATSFASSDVGDVGLIGHANFDSESGTWTLAGAGAGIPVPPFDAPDAFHYAFRQIKGDVAIVTRVTARQGTDAGTQAGVMIRESLAADAKNVVLLLQPGGIVATTWRGATAWNKTNISWFNGPGGYQTHGGPNLPWWLKLERLGTRLYAYHSPDGVNWTCMSTVEIALPDTALLGLCVSSRDTSGLGSATFAQVRITNPAPAGSPEITSATAATAAVGTPFSYTVTASGSPSSFGADGLPAGLSINASTGVISGTAATPGRSLVTLHATNASGTGTSLLVLTITSDTAPAAPATLTATDVNGTRVALSWAASLHATSYTVKRSLTPGGPYETIVSGVAGTSYVDRTAYPGHNYYVVTAWAGALEGAPSAEAAIQLPPSIPPSAPTIVHGDTQVTLSWPETPGAQTYSVKRAAASGGPYAVVASGITGTTYTDTGLTNGTLYYYVVTSVAGALESAPSPEELGVPGATLGVWSASASSGAWSTGANWQGGVAPASPAFLGFGSSTTAALTNDLEGFKAARITFAPGAPAYTIAGNAITLGDSITNQSSARHSISTPLVLTGPTRVHVTGGSLNLDGVISGSGSLVKRGSQELKISGANTYSGGTVIRDSVGGWGPNAPLSVEGTGTGSVGAPTSGPLGTGPIVLEGGALMNTANATLYNDIIVPEGARSFLYNFSGNFNLAGRLKGSGTITYDGTTTAAVSLNGDNSEFAGTFVIVNRSSNQRIHFNTTSAGSAKAHWVFDSTFTDTPRLAYSGMMPVGAFSGGGAMRSIGGTPGLQIGALNLDTEYRGVMSGYIAIEKIGTGILRLSGVNTNGGPTTVTAGTLLINGGYTAAVTANGGTFGGTGSSTGPVSINAGAIFAPGDQGIGTFTTTNALTLSTGATFAAELDTTAARADRVSAGSVALNNATLSLTDRQPGALPLGTAFTLISNTGSSAVSGTFNGLPETARVQVGGHAFRITYRGGDGNDVVLHDDRTSVLPAAVAGLTASALDSQRIHLTWAASPASEYVAGYAVKRATTPGGPYTTVAAHVSSNQYTDTALTYNTAYYYVVAATNYMGAGADSSEASATTPFPNLSPAPAQVTAVAGSGRIDLTWSASTEASSYRIKRAVASGGPFTTIGESAATSFTDASVSDGTTYYYVVTALNVSGEGEATAEVSATPAPGAHSYWPFNEAGGTNAVDLWGGRNGTLAAGASFVAGASGNGLRLTSASNSFVTLPNGAVSSLSDFTISAWVKLDAVANWARLFDFGTGTSNFMYLAPRHGNAGNTVRFEITRSGVTQRIDSSVALTTGTWVHLAVTRAGNTGVLYVNGVEAGRNTGLTHTPASLGVTTQTWLGRSQFASDPLLNGIVDDFRIYSRGLAPEEVGAIFAALAPPSPANFTVSGSARNVALSWSAVAGATSYTLRRATSEAGPFSTLATGLTATSYTDTSAVNGPFVYTVAARVGNFESSPSAPATIVLPPAVPANLTVGAWNGRVDLSWNAAVGAVSYDVKRALASEGPFTTIANVTTRSYSDVGLANGTTYHYVIAAVNAAGASADTAPVAATPSATPALEAWTHGDVGGVAFVGNAGYSNGAYTVYGSGADIWTQADSFHFVHQPLSGDGAIMARVTAQQNTSGFAKAGVMIRENLDTNSRHALMNRTPASAVEFIRRTAPNVNAVATTASGAGLPRWVRLVREGNTFTAYHSADGFTWSLLGTPQAISMAAAARVGLAVCAGNNGALGQATFDHVSIASALPVITSAPTAAGTYGAPFSYAITATHAPTIFRATALPPGLSLDPATGIISGTPLAAGPFSVEFTAANAWGAVNGTVEITITKASATVTLGNLVQAYDGEQKHASATTNPAGLTVSFAYEGGAVPTYPGDYDVTGTIVDDNYAGSSSDTLSVSITALVRRAPVLNGILDGSIQVLTAENLTLKETSALSGDLLVRGKPTVVIKGDPTRIGTRTGPGAATPTSHSVTINDGAVLRYLVLQVDPIDLPSVSAPATPIGTRSVTLSKAGQSVGNWSTLRNLTLNGGAGKVAVPPGAYGNFIANGETGFVLGDANATNGEPVHYHFQNLTLNGGSTLEVVGPVIVTLANGTTINAQAGSATHPEWLTLQVHSGGVTLNTGATLDGHVIAPAGTVTINTSATLRGSIAADGLTINSGGLLDQIP